MPLFIAAHSGHIKMIDFLLNSGDDLNHKNKDIKTALFYVDFSKAKKKNTRSELSSMKGKKEKLLQ
ncbi:MAG: ankyrin repeat domain-containing protein [Rickettsiales endosymbiont of Dermacentor nuttalli]